MNELVKSLIQPLLENNPKKIALIPGGYKPPTGGHFYIVNEMAKRAEIDDVIVLIGHKERDGITKEDSIQIWDIYKKYLPSNVEIRLSSKTSPIPDIHKIIGENPQNFYYPVVGMRNQDDIKDQQRFDSLYKKYSNFKPIIVPGDPEISGTKSREAIRSGSFEKFQKYLPTELNGGERKEIWGIINKIEEKKIKDPYGINQYSRELMNEAIVGDKIECDNCDWSWDIADGGDDLYLCHKCGHDNTPKTPGFDYQNLITDITEYMGKVGLNINPLPKIEFIHDDEENADNFLGKTAYYSPTEKLIVLYTCKRHPKDVAKSFTHEMVHHIQNLEDRLGIITTQNTNEDDHLNEIEKEAYMKGNIIFRNYTDSLK